MRSTPVEGGGYEAEDAIVIDWWIQRKKGDELYYHIVLIQIVGFFNEKFTMNQ